MASSAIAAAYWAIMIHEYAFFIKASAAIALLVWAVVEDMRTRKFSNRTFLISLGAAVVIAVVTGGFAELIPATVGFIAGIAFFLPLVLLGVVGAGDMKLMAVFGVLMGWNAVLWTGVYGVLWAGVFGVAQIIFKGQLKTLMHNLTSLAVTRTNVGLQLHHIPFTAPLLLGSLSYLVLSGVL